MGRARSGEASALVSVRAVDAAYPLRGTVEADGDGTLAQQLQARDGLRGVLVDSQLLERLGVNVGDRIGLGEAEFEIRGILHGVPDQVSQGIAIGFPLLVSIDGLGGDRQSFNPAVWLAIATRSILPTGLTPGAR